MTSGLCYCIDIPYLWIESLWNSCQPTVGSRLVLYYILLLYPIWLLGQQLGDYGYFTKSKHFYPEGNILTDLKSQSSKADITPRQHKIFEINEYDTHTTCAMPQESKVFSDFLTLYKPIGLSLPNHKDFYLLLTHFSTQLANKYLVTRIIQCTSEHCRHTELFYLYPISDYCIASSLDSNGSMNSHVPLCTIAQPYIWHKIEGAGWINVQWMGCEMPRVDMSELGSIWLCEGWLWWWFCSNNLIKSFVHKYFL